MGVSRSGREVRHYRRPAPGAAGISRRAVLAGAAAGALATAPGIAHATAAPATVRLGLLQFGTVQWIADVIRRHALDTAHGIVLSTAPLANTEAGRIALMAGGADVVVSDWLFAASQRAGGTKLCFAPLSSATGGAMARADSPLRSLADLRGRRLGVAGGPADKSWVLVQAAARKQGLDLATAAHVNYGAPPLLEAKLLQGELDAVLTYWNFAARLEAQGAREVVSVADCERQLGLTGDTAMVGYVFHETWAAANRTALDGFLAASYEAEQALAHSDTEWQAVRPLMNAPGDALFARLKARFLAGIVPPGTRPQQERDAARILAILNETGGTRAAGGITALPAGLFWRTGNEA
jgi:NitT/TauT family transport system substrate-binding protein